MNRAGQMEYASKQLLCAVHMRGGPQAPCGLLVSLDEMVSRYWSDSAAGVACGHCCPCGLLFEKDLDSLE